MRLRPGPLLALLVAAGVAWVAWRGGLQAPSAPPGDETHPPAAPAPAPAFPPPAGVAAREDAVRTYAFHFNRRGEGEALLGAAGSLVLRGRGTEAGKALWACDFVQIDRVAALGPGAPAEPDALRDLAQELAGEVIMVLGPGCEILELRHAPGVGSRRREIHELWAQVWPPALGVGAPGLQIERDPEGLPLRVRGEIVHGAFRLAVSLQRIPDPAPEPPGDVAADPLPAPAEPDGETVARLERALADPDPVQREEALRELGALAGRTSSARLRDQLAEHIEELLSGGLHDPAQVIEALRDARAERSIPALLPFLEHPQARARLAAVQALGVHAAARAQVRERLAERAAGDDDPRVREEAQTILGGR